MPARHKRHIVALNINNYCFQCLVTLLLHLILILFPLFDSIIVENHWLIILSLNLTREVVPFIRVLHVPTQTCAHTSMMHYFILNSI